MTYPSFSRNTILLLVLSLTSAVICSILLFTRFGVFLIFDVVTEIGVPATPPATYHDAPYTVTETLASPTQVTIPDQIDQISGIFSHGERLILATDQSEIFALNIAEPSNVEGGNLFPTTPLLMRQGRLEAITWNGHVYELVGGFGRSIQTDLNLNRIEDRALPASIASLEFSGVTSSPEGLLLTHEESAEIVVIDQASGMPKSFSLNFGSLLPSSTLATTLRWSGIAYDDGLLYLSSDTHPVVVVASAATAEVVSVLGFDGDTPFSDVAVSDGKIFLPRDHNYFDERPPLLIFDLGTPLPSQQTATES